MGLMASKSTWGDEDGSICSTPDDRGRGYPALDGLRGLAAIIVVYYHVTGVATGFQGGIFGHGYLAVDLFFALSGFVLFHAYEERFRQGLSVGTFLRLRLVRLYPLYAVGLLIGLAANMLILLIDPPQAMTGGHLLSSIATGLVLLPSLPPTGDLFPLNGPCWTLMLELMANILMAILWPRIGVRSMVVLCATLAVVLTVYGTAHGDVAAGDKWINLLFGLVRCALSFSIGILVRLLSGGRATGPAPGNVMVGLLCLSLAALLIWSPPAQYAALYDLGFILVASPLFILLGSRITPTGQTARLCTLSGGTSYALYVTHCPMIGVVLLWSYTTGTLVYRDHLLLFATGYTLVFTALAYALDRLYDVPVRRWLGRQQGRTASNASPASHPAPVRARAG